jgi:hypothetical protein
VVAGDIAQRQHVVEFFPSDRRRHPEPPELFSFLEA